MSQNHLGRWKYKYICFLEIGNSGVQGKVVSLLFCGAVPCSGERPSDLCCVYSTEKPELVPQGAGSARAAFVWHNQPCCSRTGRSLSEVWHCTAAGHRARQPQSPTATRKLTREVSAEVGMNPVALRWDQTAKFALLLSKEALRGAAHLFLLVE